MQVVAQDAGLAEAAREPSSSHGKDRHPAALNLGDCASYALAKTQSLKLLFKGSNFPGTDLMAAI